MNSKKIKVNNHFIPFLFNWDYKKYFLVGGYGSSKSYNVATKIILKLIQEKRKCLVVREVYDTIRDSCFSLFKEILEIYGLSDVVKTKESPMKITFPNGSEIIFKGLDSPQKLKSINGVSIVWLEECSECKYEAYKELLGRLRHKTMSNHLIMSTNPVSELNWTFKHFFKYKDDTGKENIILDDYELYEKRVIVKGDTYYHHSTCEDNAFLPEDYIKELDEMKKYDPDLYRVARLGHFGVNGTKVLPQFEEMQHEDVMEAVNKIPSRLHFAGGDFGFVTSYNAFLKVAVDEKTKSLYIYKEYYTRGITDDILAEDLIREGFKGELIRADCAEPKTIAYLNSKGLRVVPCKKFKGSVLQNIKKIKRFKHIYVSSNCINSIKELKNLTYKIDKKGDVVEDEFNIDSHCLDSIAYGLDTYNVENVKTLNRRKYGI